jgi:hypothetical protein
MMSIVPQAGEKANSRDSEEAIQLDLPIFVGAHFILLFLDISVRNRKVEIAGSLRD